MNGSRPGRPCDTADREGMAVDVTHVPASNKTHRTDYALAANVPVTRLISLRQTTRERPHE